MKVTLILFGLRVAQIKAVYAAEDVSRLTDRPTAQVSVEVDALLGDEAAADYAFELSNSPAREDEWVKVSKGGCRSLSVGDVVRIDRPGVGPVNMACMPCGWLPVDDAVVSKLDSAADFSERGQICRDLSA